MSLVPQLLSRVRASYGLDRITAERAVITAPFGQKYFDECARRFSASRTLWRLSAKNEVLIMIVTSKKTRIRPVSGARIVQIDPIPDWPMHDRYQSRFVKWGIPHLYPGIRQSLYADSDLHITSSMEKLLRLFDRIDRDRFVVTEHKTRRNWEEECSKVISSGRALDVRRVEAQRQAYHDGGLPAQTRVFQTNFIGRVHGSEYDALSASVLSEIMRHSERDQLALPRALFLSGLRLQAAGEGEFLYTGFKNLYNSDSLCFVDRMAAGRFYISGRDQNARIAEEQTFPERALNKLFNMFGCPHL